jgi:hypothetical protein
LHGAARNARRTFDAVFSTALQCGAHSFSAIISFFIKYCGNNKGGD